jgi:hypothetical protein
MEPILVVSGIQWMEPRTGNLGPPRSKPPTGTQPPHQHQGGICLPQDARKKVRYNKADPPRAKQPSWDMAADLPGTSTGSRRSIPRHVQAPLSDHVRTPCGLQPNDQVTSKCRTGYLPSFPTTAGSLETHVTWNGQHGRSPLRLRQASTSRRPESSSHQLLAQHRSTKGMAMGPAASACHSTTTRPPFRLFQHLRIPQARSSHHGDAREPGDMDPRNEASLASYISAPDPWPSLPLPEVAPPSLPVRRRLR